MINAATVTVILSVIAFVTVITLLLTKKVNVKNSNGKKKQLGSKEFQHNPAEGNYLDPKPFNVGLIRDKPYKTANMCNDQILYPIKNLDVKYGLPKISDNCPCTDFIKAP
jgi:hypothetical protein